MLVSEFIKCYNTQKVLNLYRVLASVDEKCQIEVFKFGGNTMEHLEDVVKLLDSMTEAGVSRMKVETSEAVEGGISQKAYHHGRCDVGSPFATGKLFDLEDTADP